MSQTYTASLGRYAKELWVVELPYLFRNHQHAAKVLDGPIGQRIMAGLESNGVKGLGFTYSGGYRVIPSRTRIFSKVDDFKGRKIRVTSENPISASYMKELGAIPVHADVIGGKDTSEAFETTYARAEDVQSYEAKFIAETNHSLFLTTILIHKKFFDSLPADLQKVIIESAREAAALERADSIKDGLESKKKFKAKGIQIVEISPVETEKMNAKALVVHRQYENFFAPHLISEIQNTW